MIARLSCLLVLLVGALSARVALAADITQFIEIFTGLMTSAEGGTGGGTFNCDGGTANCTHFRGTLFSLDPSEYDGTVTYRMELVVRNGDGGEKKVWLLNASDASVALTMAIPASSSTFTRREYAWSPSAAGTYFLAIEESDFFANRQQVSHARVVIKQTGATKTRAYTSLYCAPEGTSNRLTNAGIACHSYSSAGGAEDGPASPAGASSYWLRENAYLQGTRGNWRFEAPMATTASFNGKVELYNRTAGQVVATLTHSGGTTALVSASVADDAEHFTDGHEFVIRGYREAGAAGNFLLFPARLSVPITDIAGEVISWSAVFGRWDGRSSDFVTGDQHFRHKLDVGACGGAAMLFEPTYRTSGVAGVSQKVQLRSFATSDSNAGTSGSVVHEFTPAGTTKIRERAAVMLADATRYQAFWDYTSGTTTMTYLPSFIGYRCNVAATPTPTSTPTMTPTVSATPTRTPTLTPTAIPTECVAVRFEYPVPLEVPYCENVMDSPPVTDPVHVNNNAYNSIEDPEDGGGNCWDTCMSHPPGGGDRTVYVHQGLTGHAATSGIWVMKNFPFFNTLELPPGKVLDRIQLTMQFAAVNPTYPQHVLREIMANVRLGEGVYTGDNQAHGSFVNGLLACGEFVGDTSCATITYLWEDLALNQAQVNYEEFGFAFQVESRVWEGMGPGDSMSLSWGCMEIGVVCFEDGPTPTPTETPDDTPTPTPTETPDDTPTPTPTPTAFHVGPCPGGEVGSCVGRARVFTTDKIGVLRRPKGKPTEIPHLRNYMPLHPSQRVPGQ